MFLARLLRSFIPLHNPIGFGASDFIELEFALVLAALAFAWRPWIKPFVTRLAPATRWSMLALALAPVVLRLLLLAHHAIPTPLVADEFSHLLVADTLLHFRLANPAHSLHQFFETYFVLQEPTYSSIYAIGQGLALAVGRAIFGHPWAGVALTTAVFCALCYWMLRGWIAPGWALAGGVLAVCEFGPLTQWMNTYWGGAVAAGAGCLVFGSLPRLHARGRTHDAALLGAGLGIHLLTRPYESVFLALSVLLFFAPSLWQREGARKLMKLGLVAALVAFPAVAVTLLQNRAVTGSWTTLPYVLSRYQYGVPAAFTFEPNAVPHRELTPEQQLDYQVQSVVHGTGTETFARYLEDLRTRVRFYRFFFFSPLYLVLPLFFVTLREWRFCWVAVTLALFAAGANLYPYFYPHYIAAECCLFVLVSVRALEILSRWTVHGQPAGAMAARLLLFLCFAHFLFWYTMHASESDEAAAMIPYETWDLINQGDPEGRILINRRLAESSGKQLVFVRYWPQHRFREWVYDPADMDGARVVWARDLGEPENQKLLRYYPDRHPWLLEPDAWPPRLEPYPSGAGAVAH